MNKGQKNACEAVDASVFSGDILYDKDSLHAFKEYVGRWNRAIQEQEENQSKTATLAIYAQSNYSAYDDYTPVHFKVGDINYVLNLRINAVNDLDDGLNKTRESEIFINTFLKDL